MRHTFLDTFSGEMYQKMSSVDILEEMWTGSWVVPLPRKMRSKRRIRASPAHFFPEMRQKCDSRPIPHTEPRSAAHHMTVESVRASGRPRSRNELMVNAVVAARLMERRGRGWLIMRQAMAEHGLPEPEIENDPVARVVRVTLWRERRGASAGASRVGTSTSTGERTGEA